VPITAICLIVAVFTTLFIVYFGRRLDHFGFERFMAVYGTATGTGASGLLLLRIVDPEFKSPAAQELGLYNAFALPLLLPVSFFVFPLPEFGLAPLLALAAGLIVVCLVLLKVFRFWGKPVWK
jgi:ESS family glutamate:Na+ symporter